MKPMLIRYVRDKNWNPIGCIVALDGNRIGWSLCNVSAKDVFTKKMAKRIAINRANSIYRGQVPYTLFRDYCYVFEYMGIYFSEE